MQRSHLEPCAKGVVCYQAIETTGKWVMNKQDIVRAIHERIGFSKRETAAIVDAALETIKTTLAEGKPVMISNFGKLTTQQRKSQKARNLQTGEIIVVPPRKALSFKASRALKERINEALRARDT